MEYLGAIAAIFAVNLLPAFGPPTWAVLVFFHLTFGLEPLVLVPAGAVAAASGRFLLAHGARRFRSRLSSRSRANLEAARELLAGERKRALAGLGLFALSPVPSAQLFVAAGLLGVPLGALTCAFFAGRLVSYSIYVGGASVAADSLPDLAEDVFSSPLGIAAQLAMLALLVALARIDWGRLLERWQERRGEPRQSSM